MVTWSCLRSRRRTAAKLFKRNLVTDRRARGSFADAQLFYVGASGSCRSWLWQRSAWEPALKIKHSSGRVPIRTRHWRLGESDGEQVLVAGSKASSRALRPYAFVARAPSGRCRSRRPE